MISNIHPEVIDAFLGGIYLVSNIEKIVILYELYAKSINQSISNFK
jgi:hypothetical protein